MLRSITAAQFAEWLEYSRLEPFDEMRADYRAAQIAQMIANVNRDPKKYPNGFPITDFLLKFGEPAAPTKKPRQSWQDQKMIAQMYVAMLAPPGKVK